eukprot:c19850_g1_i1.p1 GENE.c19850_g1_i1~~c19850_g1_i1.p1  ORF type:complete len:683 (+),score=147.11 c19850_g1_i1:366-2414(+)
MILAFESVTDRILWYDDIVAAQSITHAAMMQHGVLNKCLMQSITPTPAQLAVLDPFRVFSNPDYIWKSGCSGYLSGWLSTFGFNPPSVPPQRSTIHQRITAKRNKLKHQFFVLRDSALLMFNGSDTQHFRPLGVMYLLGTNVSLSEQGPTPYGFKIRSPRFGDEIECFVMSEELRDRWVTAIRVATRVTFTDLQTLKRSQIELAAVSSLTPLHTAVQQRDLPAVREVLRASRTDPTLPAPLNARDNFGRTPLMLVPPLKSWRLYHHLLAMRSAPSKTDPFHPDDTGPSPFSEDNATASVTVMFRYLLRQRGIDVRAADDNGNTALQYLLASDTPDAELAVCVKLLVEGPEVKSNDTLSRGGGGGAHHFHLSTDSEEDDESHSHDQYCDLLAKNHKGQTALHSLIAIVLENDMSLEEACGRAFTLLSVSRYLVSAGADLLVKCNAGTTPLGHCLRNFTLPPEGHTALDGQRASLLFWITKALRWAPRYVVGSATVRDAFARTFQDACGSYDRALRWLAVIGGVYRPQQQQANADEREGEEEGVRLARERFEAAAGWTRLMLAVSLEQSQLIRYRLALRDAVGFKVAASTPNQPTDASALDTNGMLLRPNPPAQTYEKSLVCAMLCAKALGVAVPTEVWQHIVRVGEVASYPSHALVDDPPLPATRGMPLEALVDLARALGEQL